MSDEALRLAEFRALRATIRERDTTRLVLVLVASLGWASLAVAIVLVAPLALLLVIPLLVLSAGFEVNVAIHLAVERTARYLQAAFEHRDAAWETTWRELARRFPGRRADPLFFWVFVAAVCANFLCVLLTNAEATDLAAVTLIHVGVLVRFVVARRRGRAEESADHARLEELLRRREDGSSAS